MPDSSSGEAISSRAAAGLLDVLWSPTTFERLVRTWKLDDTTASEAVEWLIDKVVEAVTTKPTTKGPPRR